MNRCAVFSPSAECWPDRLDSRLRGAQRDGNQNRKTAFLIHCSSDGIAQMVCALSQRCFTKVAVMSIGNQAPRRKFGGAPVPIGEILGTVGGGTLAVHERLCTAGPANLWLDT